MSLSSISYGKIIAGQPVDFKIKASFTKTITSGAKIHVTAKLGFITGYENDFDICTTKGISCPLAPGDQELSFQIDIPSFVPSGITVDVTSVSTNGDGSSLVCINNPSFAV